VGPSDQTVLAGPPRPDRNTDDERTVHSEDGVRLEQVPVPGGLPADRAAAVERLKAALLQPPSTRPAAVTTPLLRPVSVPGYQVLGELGRGAVGVVYKARQVGLNRLVALKMILAGAHASQHTLS